MQIFHETGNRLGDTLDRVLAEEPHLPYANFSQVAAREGAAAALHKKRFQNEENNLGILLAKNASDRVVAAIRLQRRPFETEHFGIEMASIDLPLAVADEAARSTALQALYESGFARLRQDGYAHVSCRASTRDPVAGWALQEAGARHVDTQVSWMAPLTGQPHDSQVAPPVRLEVFNRQQLADLDPSSWKRIAEWGSVAFDRGPLVFDAGLPTSKAKQVYAAWTAKALGGEWADAALLARNGTEVVAFISMLELEDVSVAAGVKVAGRGLGATLPEYRGLFTALQREMIAARPLDAEFMENETQVATIGSINVYAKLGFRYLRSTSTFHAWLNGSVSSTANYADSGPLC